MQFSKMVHHPILMPFSLDSHEDLHFYVKTMVNWSESLLLLVKLIVFKYL